MLSSRHLTKTFGGLPVLQDVSLDFLPGEVHALMGENGAGKSTLMKILAGLYAPDSGTLTLRASPLTLTSPHEALNRGIAMIHQELMPIPDLTVAENILLGLEPVKAFGRIDRTAMHTRCRELLALLDTHLAPDLKMRQLSVAQTQVVEIAKALGRQADILLMDEPTAALSDHEIAALFRVIAKLKARGVTVIYTTHKMAEVFQIADRITVLRDGQRVDTRPAADFTPASLISLMVGRDLADIFPARSPQIGEIVLEVRDLTREPAYRHISFCLHRGEVLGLAGLMGAGRTEVASALFGLQPATSGEIHLRGHAVRMTSPAAAIAAGIGMVTEDRQGLGIIPAMSVQHNLTLASLRALTRGPLIHHQAENQIAAREINTFGIRTASAHQAIGELSGGNQQKTLLARTLLHQPDVVILDEPTRGIDIGAKAEIYRLIRQLCDQGKAVLLVSSELPEILSLCHRVLVLRQGSLAAELNPTATSPEEILRHAMPA